MNKLPEFFIDSGAYDEWVNAVSAKAKTEQDIIDLRARGLTFDEIGKIVNLSRGRAHWIFNVAMAKRRAKERT